MARKSLGYVVVTFDPRSRHPFIGFMHDSLSSATEARERMSAEPGERHVVAEVFEVPDTDVTGRALAGKEAGEHG